MWVRKAYPALVCVTALTILAGEAAAHEATGVAGGFRSGLLHPVLGWDHVAAMVAVGLLGAVMGPPALWLLPIVFPLVMAAGGALGVAGVPVPGVELGIALSAVVLGLMVALGRPVPAVVAAIVVGCFAIFHGHAHGTELPAAASAVAYGVGFVVGTGLLHLVGIGIGALGTARGHAPVRAAGGLISLAGLYFVAGVLWAPS
jgi:urease accessory protein